MISIRHGIAGARHAADTGALAIVVDALRSSATLCSMFEAGFAEVRVCSGVDTAFALAAQIKGAVLAGEKHSHIPHGFALGNSPLEIRRTRRRGTAVFTSTNGALMLCAARGAGSVVVGGVNNAARVAAIAHEFRSVGKDIVIIPSGDDGAECDEDTASAVLLAELIGPDIDPAQEALLAYWKTRIAAGGLEALFRESAHGRDLVALGFAEDVASAAQADISDILPIARDFVDYHGETIAVLTAAESARQP